jgi:predicted glycoside hydrolase/deacetylase ChbG (UPF0249 family)
MDKLTPRVIVHADDFGLHPALNEGIERSHREGVVTSASLIPLGPAFGDAIRRSQAMPTLDLGLHFTLVGVTGLPPTLGAFLSGYVRGAWPVRRVADALRSQLDAVRRLPISHLDSHQHLHALPGIMRVVCPIAAEYGIRAIRLPIDGPAFAPVPPARRAQAAALAAMARLARRYIAASGLRTSDHFSGMAVSGHLTAPTLAAYLQNARGGLTEIVCHPGADNRALSHAFDWGYDWEGEAAALCSPEARAVAVTRTTWRDS